MKRRLRVRWRRRSVRRYWLALAMFLVCCAGGFLAGYRGGYLFVFQTIRPTVCLYDVAGLVPFKSQLNGAPIESVDDLVALLKSEAALDDWDDEASRARIKVTPDRQKLIVVANPRAHDVILEVLDTVLPRTVGATTNR